MFEVWIFLQPTHIVILCQNAGTKCRVMSCRPMHEILSADISAGDIFRHNEVTNPCQNKWVQWAIVAVSYPRTGCTELNTRKVDHDTEI